MFMGNQFVADEFSKESAFSGKRTFFYALRDSSIRIPNCGECSAFFDMNLLLTPSPIPLLGCASNGKMENVNCK